MSSTFVVGKADIMGDAKIKAISKYSAELDYRLIPVAVDRWKTHLNWNEKVTMVYAELMKLYYSIKMDVTDFNTSMSAKDTLWPFTVLEYECAAIGVLQGARNEKRTGGESTATKAISGALGGAAAGAMIGAEVGMIGGPWGAAIGGVLGAATAFF